VQYGMRPGRAAERRRARFAFKGFASHQVSPMPSFRARLPAACGMLRVCTFRVHGLEACRDPLACVCRRKQECRLTINVSRVSRCPAFGLVLAACDLPLFAMTAGRDRSEPSSALALLRSASGRQHSARVSPMPGFRARRRPHAVCFRAGIGAHPKHAGTSSQSASYPTNVVPGQSEPDARLSDSCRPRAICRELFYHPAGRD
jgi:hypothetical protein